MIWSLFYNRHIHTKYSSYILLYVTHWELESLSELKLLNPPSLSVKCLSSWLRFNIWRLSLSSSRMLLHWSLWGSSTQGCCSIDRFEEFLLAGMFQIILDPKMFYMVSKINSNVHNWCNCTKFTFLMTWENPSVIFPKNTDMLNYIWKVVRNSI